MRKKILIGSIIAVLLLLLMPSIPAIQQKSVEEGIKQEIQEKLDIIDFKDIKGIKILDDDVKHLFLFFIVVFIFAFRWDISYFLYVISTDFYGNILNPVIYERAVRLRDRALLIYDCWQKVSDILGWNWDFWPFVDQ